MAPVSDRAFAFAADCLNAQAPHRSVFWIFFAQIFGPALWPIFAQICSWVVLPMFCGDVE
ncbi:MAG: hypothetical protein CK530_03020 [Planctomycetaceae bacterium]|nr:MAG: hypothetical protein CK530_03020 [Planctomycetaceae bacterium]